MTSENSFNNPESFAHETEEENEIKIRMEPYQEKRILQFLDGSQEQIIEFFSFNFFQKTKSQQN